MSDLLSPDERDVIVAIAQTLIPSLEPPAGSSAEVQTFYRDSAASRGLDAGVADAVATLDQPVRDAILALVRTLAGQGFATADEPTRLAALHGAAADMRLRLGLRHLKTLLLGGFLNAVDGTGRNPGWPALGYPGPVSTPPAADLAPGRIAIVEPEPVMSADVVVIGSGAGGGVVAARCAEAGLSVVIVEAGAYRTEDTMKELDADGAGMFLRGGILWSENGQLGVLAGAVLGGGTLINSMVCLRTPDHVRVDWARRGLAGLDGPEYDAALDTVWERLGVNTGATSYNSNTRAMITGLASLGYRHERLPRNAACDDEPALCGYCNSGCLRGHKRSVLHTYLQDAVKYGARILAGTHVDTILVDGGRAGGVSATVADPDGGRQIEIKAGTVVVAAGAIESPAILLRSGIGGPAVGRNLQVHPTWIVTGVYDEPIEAWQGQIQAAISFDLTQAVDGGGFLVESLALNPGTWAGQMPFVDPASTRDRLLDMRRFATWHGVSHDHGSGEIYLDAERRAAVRWDLDDADRRIAVRAHQELARMHRAAGANEVFTFHWSDRRWRQGEDFEAYVAGFEDAPAEDFTAYSAHQMGTCRLGSDPATSVADVHGQVCDTPGVWIGDASALPTAPGVNPMITIMAMAERTAAALIGSRG